MLNTALSRCRIREGVEGHLIVIANYQHIKDRYPGSAVLQFLNRIRFQTDTLTDDESISRFQKTIETLIKEIREDQPDIIKSLANIETASKQAVERLIWSYCDVIPRLIQLCNRLSPSFIQTDGTRKHLEQLPGSAQRFADLSDSWIYADPNEHQDGFASVINHLYQVIYETTMVDKGPGERNQGPLLWCRSTIPPPLKANPTAGFAFGYKIFAITTSTTQKNGPLNNENATNSR